LITRSDINQEGGDRASAMSLRARIFDEYGTLYDLSRSGRRPKRYVRENAR
jgi:hypothetical protein